MSDDEHLASILPDVMRCLRSDRFFEALDDRFSPTDSSLAAVMCQGNFDVATSILRGLEYDEKEIEDIFEVLKFQGGFCDCEILHNVAEASHLKAAYWRGEFERLPSQRPHGPNK